MTYIHNISKERPVLIAGPTASGKSAIALEIASRLGGEIVNADALQVFENWRVLTARPSRDEESITTHHLYGHVDGDFLYSAGHWLRDVSEILEKPLRPIIVGGTGLYFSALTEGLADIPETPADVRKLAMARIDGEGIAALLAELDAETLSRIDQQNPMRIQRAWEVLTATGRSLAAWQDDTPAAKLPLETVDTILLQADKDWLTDRIERRFDAMIANGAMEEAQENFANWDPAKPSSKAIGAPELIAHLKGELSLEDAREQAKIATRQYAKRQRTWFRSRMKPWNIVDMP